MKWALWILQVVLALFFIAAVAGRYLTPREQLLENPMQAWVADIPGPVLAVISILEVAGAIGLILPAVTGIRPSLTAWAAAGLALTMVVAALFHLVRGEFLSVPLTLVWAGLAAFVAYGRFRVRPIPARGAAAAA